MNITITDIVCDTCQEVLAESIVLPVRPYYPNAIYITLICTECKQIVIVENHQGQINVSSRNAGPEHTFEKTIPTK